MSEPIRVVLVDDERIFVESLTKVLKKRGMEVLSAFDGLSALKLLSTTEPDVIVLDLRMPGMDGLEVLREIRKVDLAPWIVSKNPAFCQRIPVLLATFPEARFVHLVRDPREAIPSRLHLVRAIWRHRLPWFRDPTEAQIAAIVDDSVASYLLAHRDLSPVPRERKIVVRFEELMDDPNRTADSVRWQFGLERRAADRDPARGARKRNPRHVLAEFGLDDATIEGRLRDVFEEHGVHWKNSREEP